MAIHADTLLRPLTVNEYYMKYYGDQYLKALRNNEVPF